LADRLAVANGETHPGSLTVVGTGIDVGGHLTPQARVAFAEADEAFYLVADPVAVTLLVELNPSARSLHDRYELGRPRLAAYEAMVEEILAPVRAGKTVCAAFYGHPGIFVFPGHAAIATARGEGFRAWMLPGISSLDCLFADLGIDPAESGCLVHHASDFLARRVQPDPSVLLVLLQISVIGEPGAVESADWSGLTVLVEYLQEFYAPDHVVIGYEASPFPVLAPTAAHVPLAELATAELTAGMTLVVPPAIPAAAPDPSVLARLALLRADRQES
jgi:precorrin-6B methylase 1